MGYKLNGCDTEGLPVYFIKRLLENIRIPFFVETGTAGGESVLKAAEIFDQCYTIEIVEGRSPMTGPSNITWLVGNSGELLNKVIDEISPWQTNALFWLDAHYSDPTPNTTGNKECPLMDELEAISRYKENSIVLIDDARLFYGHPPYPLDPREWPKIQDIFCFLKQHFPGHCATITDDYIVCLPWHMQDVINDEWRSRFTLRYPNAANKLKSQVRDVFNAFNSYVNEI